MDRPLGAVAGNALEVRQAWETLSGGGPADFRDLVLELGGWMLVLIGKAKTPAQARPGLDALLRNGTARNKFLEMVKAQGGDASAVESGRLPKARFERPVAAPRAGVVQKMDTRRIGLVVSALGSGRAKAGDAVDHAAGLVFHKKTGDRVAKGEPLATAHFNDEAKWPAAEKDYLAAVSVGNGRPGRSKLILEIIR
jgi:pyrimidine-nucleoside phosphorylase